MFIRLESRVDNFGGGFGYFVMIRPLYLADLPSSDLTGIWIGDYRTHGDEWVQVSLASGEYQAIKLTGDPFVPAGELTWRTTGGRAAVEVQCAEQGFKEPWFEPADPLLVSAKALEFKVTRLQFVLKFRRPTREELLKKKIIGE